MGFVTTNKSVDLDKELNEMISSLGYEIVISPDDEEDDEENNNKDEEDDE